MTWPAENLLIEGDNQPILQALMPHFEAQIQCVYLDPPYNTGVRRRGNQESSGYSDAFDSGTWMEAMKTRLEAIKALMKPEGSLFLQLDEHQIDASKLLLDEIFGKDQFVNRIVVQARAPSSFSTVNKGLFKSTEYILWFCKNKKLLNSHALRVPKKPDPAYRMWLINPESPPEAWRFESLKQAHPKGDLDKIRVEQSARVCRLAPISDTKAGHSTIQAKLRSIEEPTRVFVVHRESHPPQYLLRGNQVIFYDKQVTQIDGKHCASSPMTNLWTDISWEGIANEGGVIYKTGKKPERLIRRCLRLCTEPGDWVLDAFLGSGTTAATAHKMQRRWIGIEQGGSIALAKNRIQRVCSGEDQTGISKTLQWSGGGSFSHYQWDDGLTLVE